MELEMGKSAKGKLVIVIGAGIGGCSLAARLAKDGFDVRVFEKNSFSGGRLSLIEKNGYRFDQGPSLYLMPKLFAETFSDLGERVEDHIELLRCPNNYKVYFHDGDTFLLNCDMVNLYRQIEKHEGSSEQTLLNFMDFMKETHVHYERSIDVALKTNYTHWWDEFQLGQIPNVLKLHIHDNVYSRICKYFKSDKMRKAFTFQTMYVGTSPHDTLASFSLLQYTELAEGVWYPRGGFHKVVESLEGIATRKFGVQFNYDCDIEKIIVDEENTARGIRFTDGREEYADIVVCNADLVYAYNKLLPETSYGKKLGDKGVLTSSSVSFYWGMSRKIPKLDTHNIFLSKEYKPSFDKILKEHSVHEDPFFYIHVPTQLDESAAPEGKDTLVVLVPVGHLTENNKDTFDDLVKSLRSKVIRRIEEQVGIAKLESLIETEVVNDPRTWQQKFNLWKGSILGLSHHIPQVLYFRPSNRSPVFKNLYFVGASTHPGTGVPIVLCGAKLTEQRILEDCGLIPKFDDTPWIFAQFVAFFFVIGALIAFVLSLF